MKRLHKRLIAGIAIVAVCLLNYLERRSYLCQVCFSGRDDYQWRIGDWGPLSAPLTPTWSRFHFSRFAQEFALRKHQHQWKFAQGSPYYLFGTMWGGCALGSGRHTSILFRTYEMDRKFRRYVNDEIASGRISTSRFIELASCVDGDDMVRQRQAQEFLDEYYSK
jgi:hypothetical protein